MHRSLFLAACLAVSFCLPARAADGAPDPSFGDGGRAFVTPDDVEARTLYPYASAVLPDGKLLFGGFRGQFNPKLPWELKLRAMLARMNADGSVDTSFGNTSIPGVVVLPDLVPNTRIQSIQSMYRLEDGSILAAGTAVAEAPATGFVLKLHADGSFDTGFGTQGKTVLPYTEFDALAVDSQGRIVVAGTNVEDFGRTIATVVRLLPDGSFDAGFGDAGVRAIDWDDATHAGSLDDVALTADDRIVVGGRYSTGGPNSDFAIARLAADGRFDTSFAERGWRSFNDTGAASPRNGVERLALAADGSIVFAGQYTNAAGRAALVLGRLAADGATDAGFGDTASPGYLKPAILSDAFGVDATDLLIQPDGKPVVAVTYFAEQTKKQFFVLRAGADGRLDTGFADGGLLIADLAPDGAGSETGCLVQQPDGRLVVAGRAERSDPLGDLAVLRLLGDAPTDRVFADGFD
ncbi:hypothetical protein [Dokdonella sp.]|uniref:hypothetical protein n=1 Tax=Dokdonella sp. TaxID=2291710 RepID=UPI001B064BE7|nr:hypothetical protein [Dokdonella sp.]MBO9664348.1 hypothetical protein [Dokdonella sp.]